VSSKVGGQIWSSVFFSWRNFTIFQQRNWENFGKFCFSSANLINFAKLFFLVKVCQNFDMKKMGKKKYQFGGWCKEILCSSIQFENLSLLSKVAVIHKIN
jgi:hypothetical protein